MAEVPGRTAADAQREFAAAVLLIREEVCSPIHRCFPPRPTLCAFCRREDKSECPFSEEGRAKVQAAEERFERQVLGLPEDAA